MGISWRTPLPTKFAFYRLRGEREVAVGFQRYGASPDRIQTWGTS